ncbi:hypothetical protein BW723_14485 [Polaribacter reichenbachii]|uniref:Uncharacterized protein n=1 Tax=Polaribacter reichenbachii TaxID=996801 RepID=A0A1B8U462_9FLAO|nr:hypothetical protein [Polaribacter reichenbachii]APZ47417.1 hypothetical protein BW723_14485 [Polaribacter reichenbachii]AUC18056.1 hypothetical protein BTO17_04930 [Polaribacter reichenbachii]OBY66666.1 hypothetical protein LPB301_05555 [Polaribacter reichenbachii]
MEIIITKGKNRSTLSCIRKDGSNTSQNLGPDFPNHDIAHFIVEKEFKLENGFYGKIKSGKTIAELSDKETIKTLGAETWLSEIMARNLQAVGSGAVNIDEYIEIVHWEAKSINGIKVPAMHLSDIKNMKQDFDQLCKDWNAMAENDQLRLNF